MAVFLGVFALFWEKNLRKWAINPKAWYSSGYDVFDEHEILMGILSVLSSIH